ncbi:MAG: TolC family protein [Tannerellaceae bacterium]|jgi:cobalt-zinc-cadmium efflux system outer membrane protein|nr:TolC family protein [Tannerellaceae bacterium]
MKIYWILFINLCTLINVFAQEEETIKLTPEEIEAAFLKQNLELIAERMNISIADAAVIQARLWDNPTLSVGDVNFWTPRSEPKATQFSIELSQLIQTANKRGKLVAMEKISKDMAIRQFEEVVRGLKIELRKSIYELMYLDAYQQVLKVQVESLSKLLESYTKQVVRGNLAKGEILRLQAALFEVENEMNEIQTERNAQQKTLKVLLNVGPLVTIEIINGDRPLESPEVLSITHLMQLADDYHPGLRLFKLQTSYCEKSLAYEKAQRVPDITVNASYDRYGGVWRNFVGFGISIGLPLLNRNQGAIKAAQIRREQSLYAARQQQQLVQHEITEVLNNYTLAYKFYKKITENALLEELDSMTDIYAKNLLNRNIGMAEYMDFMDTYKNNKHILLTTYKNVFNQYEELQFTVGTDLSLLNNNVQ